MDFPSFEPSILGSPPLETSLHLHPPRGLRIPPGVKLRGVRADVCAACMGGASMAGRAGKRLQFAIEHGPMYRWFTHKMVIFHRVMLLMSEGNALWLWVAGDCC